MNEFLQGLDNLIKKHQITDVKIKFNVKGDKFKYVKDKPSWVGFLTKTERIDNSTSAKKD